MCRKPFAIVLWIGTVAILVGFSTVLLARGRAPQQSGLIPFGEWAGTGVFVYEHWSDGAVGNPRPTDALCAHREYATTLSITPGRLDGRDVVVVNIRSTRGTLPGMESLGGETHIRAALAEAKSLSNGSALFSVVALQLNPAPGERFKSRSNPAPFSASCMTIHGQTVLQIVYLDGFVDTFRFDGRYVEKSGAFADKQTLLHWTECLEAPDITLVRGS